MTTLSAPAWSSLRTSSTLRTPPPTASGMKHPSAVRITMSNSGSRFSLVAVMSRKTSSSAPWASYTLAAVTGAPVSRAAPNRTVLMQRPSLRRRDGMRRRFSTAARSSFPAQKVLEEALAVVLTLLGMELGAEHVAPLDRCRERRAVVARRRHRGELLAHEVIAVDEVERRPVLDAVQQGARSHRDHL